MNPIANTSIITILDVFEKFEESNVFGIKISTKEFLCELVIGELWSRWFYAGCGKGMQHAFQLSSVLQKIGVQFHCKVLSFILFYELFLLFKARLYTCNLN